MGKGPFHHLWRKLVNGHVAASLAHKFRTERMLLFRQLTAGMAKPIKILDIGGTEEFWEKMGFAGDADHEITVLNFKKLETRHPNIISVAGNACNLEGFSNKNYDVVFSNATIEHVGDFEKQRKVADGIIRISARYFVQTPNKGFPIEPHFFVPFFQFFPRKVKVFLTQRFDMGFLKAEPRRDLAESRINSIRLLTQAELRKLFPGAHFYLERVWGLVKSFVVYGGF